MTHAAERMIISTKDSNASVVWIARDDREAGYVVVVFSADAMHKIEGHPPGMMTAVDAFTLARAKGYCATPLAHPSLSVPLIYVGAQGVC